MINSYLILVPLIEAESYTCFYEVTRGVNTLSARNTGRSIVFRFQFYWQICNLTSLKTSVPAKILPPLSCTLIW
jgi:hypothetical protein